MGNVNMSAQPIEMAASLPGRLKVVDPMVPSTGHLRYYNMGNVIILGISSLFCSVISFFNREAEGSGLSIMWTPWCHLLANCDTPLHRLCEHVRSPVYSGSSFFNRESGCSGLSIMRLVELGGVGWRVGVKGLAG